MFVFIACSLLGITLFTLQGKACIPQAQEPTYMEISTEGVSTSERSKQDVSAVVDSATHIGVDKWLQLARLSGNPITMHF